MKKIIESLLEELVDEASAIAAGAVSATGGSPVGQGMKKQHKVLWSGNKEGDKNTLVAEESVTKQTMQQGMPEPSPQNSVVETGQELDEKRSKSIMAKPMIAYHGTNSTFLPNIVNNGLSPDKSVKRNIWQDSEEDELSRLDSLPGVYLSGAVSDAISYAIESANRFGGKPVIIIVQVVPQSVYADEDHFDLMRTLERNLLDVGRGGSTRSGRVYNLAFSMYHDQRTFETIEKSWEGAFKKQFPEIPVNHELLMRAFRLVALDLIRDIPQMYSIENFAGWMQDHPEILRILKIKVPENFHSNGFSDDAALSAVVRAQLEEIADNIVDSAQAEFSESAYKEMQNALTKYYAVHYRKDPVSYRTFRLDQTIGFSGRNKIVGIAIAERTEEGREWRMLYGVPHNLASRAGFVQGQGAWDQRQQALRQQQQKQQQQIQVQESTVAEILENVLDKMGLQKATGNIRKGALSGEVYMDRHDSDKKRTKDVVSKVAKNLNKEPYSHDPPMMGIQEKNKK